LIIGTAGHVDHGKSSLVRALTGTDPDRLKEEKERGITIDLGFAYWKQADGRVIGFIDVPGHERFVHTMLAGAHGIDLVLLVVAADDGVMPQTREHLAIMRLLGLTRAVVALTKVDLVDSARREAVAAAVAALLAPTPFAGCDIIPVSVISGEGMDALADRLRAEPAQDRAGDLRFRLAVDRCFSLSGAGTIVTGTVLSGGVAVGERVLVSPSGLEARVRSLHRQNRAAEAAVAGDRCALNLAGPAITRTAILRGDMVLDPVLHAPSRRIDARIAVLGEEKCRLTSWMPIRLHHAAADVPGRLVPLDADSIAPGETGLVQLVLDAPVAALAGDRVVLRDTSASRTLGGGVLLDLRAPDRRRRTPERLAVLDALYAPVGPTMLTALTGQAPWLVDLDLFLRDHGMGGSAGLAVEAADALLHEANLVMLAGEDTRWGTAETVWAGLRRSVVTVLNAFHTDNPDLQGISAPRLRLAVQPRLAPIPFRAALAGLQAAGDLVVEGAWVRRPDHVARLLAEDEAIWRAILPHLSDTERFRPPRVRDFAQSLRVDERRVRRVLKSIARRGEVDEVAQDHFFLRRTVAEMVAIAARLSEPAGALFNAASFRDHLGEGSHNAGRKVAIQVLEFLDRHGVTVRRGDERFVNRRRAGLFG
jgi:selenocysteine-specific elongation factor